MELAFACQLTRYRPSEVASWSRLEQYTAARLQKRIYDWEADRWDF